MSESIEIFDPDQPNKLAVHVPTNTADRLVRMMEAVVSQGVTKDNAEAFSVMCKELRQMESDNAVKAFNRAFAAFQGECPQVAVTKAVPMKDGRVKFRYVPMEDIQDVVKPILKKHGFSVSHSTDYRSDPIRVIATCTLIHEDGHERSANFSCRIGGGAPGLSAAQEDSSAATTAIRRAFCAVCDIVITQDTDAKNEGEQITPEEAAELERRIAFASGGDAAQIARYLKLGGAATFVEIRRERYEVLMDQLAQAEPKNPSPPAKADDRVILGKPFPASYDDAAAWRSAMIEEIGLRWNVGNGTACEIFSAMEKKSGKSYLSLEPKNRKAAWQALTTGKLDAAYAPKGIA